MSYFGRSFVFDGIACETYDLMMYDVGNQDEDIIFKGDMKIQEETVGDRWKPYFFGTKHGDKLEFDLVFGVSERRIDEGKFLDRWELAEVSAWLIGHDNYKWLYIDQPDANLYGYRCILTDMEVTQYGSVPWAIKVHVICDSSYAYLELKNITYNVSGTREITVYNESSLNTPYYPVIEYTRTGGSSFSVKNAQDNNRGPEITGIPNSVSSITVDNERCVVDNNQSVNLYPGFNFQFLRLARGYNTITITGQGTVNIKCEYPINVGG